MATTNRFDLSKLNIPDVFIVDAKIAKRIVDEAMQSHHTYWNAIEAMEKHLGGAKPVPPAVLEEQGLSWVSNWNYGKGTSKIEQIVAESVSLVRSAIGALVFSFRRFDPDKDGEDSLLIGLEHDQLRGIYSNKIARVFADTLEKDPRFSSYLNLLEYCSVTFGYASVTHDKYDWMGNANHTNSVAFEDESKANDIHCWVVFDTIKADKLYRIWLEEKQKEAAELAEGEKGEFTKVSTDGWHIRGLEEALYHAFKGQFDNDEKDITPNTWEDVLSACQDKGWSSSRIQQNLNNVSIVKIYRRELDGRISQTYVAYGNSYVSPYTQQRTTSTASNAPGFSPEFLLFQKVKKEKVADRINLIRDSGLSSSENIQNYRGIGRQCVENSVAYNRIRNGNETKLTLLGQPMFMRSSSSNGQPFQLGVTHGFTLLDPNYALPDRQFQFDLRQHMEWMRFEEAEYMRDTQHYDPRIQLSSRPNKSEVAAKTEEATSPKAAKNALKMIDYAQLFGNMIKNLVNLEKSLQKDSPGKPSLDYFYDELIYEFQDFLKPGQDRSENINQLQKLLKALISVDVEPAVDDTEALTKSLQLVTDPIQVNRLERMLFMSMGFGRREVDRLRPLITDRLDSGDDEWMAAVENDMFFNTREIQWSKNQNPIVHLNAHYAKAERVIQNVAQGEDPLRAMTFVKNMLVHSIKHLEHMAQHPFFSRFFKRYGEGYRAIGKQIPKLEAVAKQIMEQKKAQQEQGGEMTPEIMKAQADIRLKEFSAMKKEERTDYLTNVRLKQNEASLEQKRRMQEEEHKAKLNRQAEMSALKSQLAVVESAVKTLTENNGNNIQES